MSRKKGERDEEKAVSRRQFLSRSALVAGAAAMSARELASAQETAAPGAAAATGSNIRVPEEFAKAAEVPGRKAEFPMKGSEVFARVCKEEGLAALFCCPGNYQVINALADEGIPCFGGRTEGSMCSAADGFARVTGEIAACSGTEGPGFTNMIMNIAAANAARSPLLVLASNLSLSGDDTERGIQQAYQQPQTEGLRKYGKRLIVPNRVHEYAAYAFRMLKTGSPRPVHLDFPSEVYGAQFKDPSELVYYFDKTKYRTESKPNPSKREIEAAVEMIKKAERPMIVASTGVFYSRAWDALKMLAEKAQIAVVESGPSRGHFSDAHPLSASTAPDALLSVDLVILVGQYCMPTIGEYAFGPDAKFIRIDPIAEDIGRNLPIDLGIVSDEKAALEALAEAMPKMERAAWVAELAKARATFEVENDKYYETGAAYRDAVHPAVIAKGLSDFLYKGDLPPEQTTVVSGGFGIGRYTRRWLRANRPGQICNGAYQYGAIGPDVGYTFGAGAAVQLGIGVQAVAKGSPVIAVTGDAGFAYSGMEVETLSKYRIPAVIIVYNNNAWGVFGIGSQSKRALPMYLFQENVRYDKVGEALGGRGEYVTKPEEFLPALKRSYQIAAAERITTVINCQGKKEYWLRNQFPPGMLRQVEPGCMAYNH